MRGGGGSEGKLSRLAVGGAFLSRPLRVEWGGFMKEERSFLLLGRTSSSSTLEGSKKGSRGSSLMEIYFSLGKTFTRRGARWAWYLKKRGGTW